MPRPIRIQIQVFNFSTAKGYRPETRHQMISQTNAFLSATLAEESDLPRIPRRRVDEGGYSELMRFEGARELVDRWWSELMYQLERLSDRDSRL